MRWYDPRPEEIRVRTWFAWLPVTIEYETRWLETVKVECEWHSPNYAGPGFWYPLKFHNI